MGKLSGFLPANLAIFLNSESLSMTLSYAGRLACGIHPSPYAIARLAPYGKAPPTIIGGRGFVLVLD